MYCTFPRSTVTIIHKYELTHRLLALLKDEKSEIEGEVIK